MHSRPVLCGPGADVGRTDQTDQDEQQCRFESLWPIWLADVTVLALDTASQHEVAGQQE